MERIKQRNLSMSLRMVCSLGELRLRMSMLMIKITVPVLLNGWQHLKLPKTRKMITMFQ